MAGRHTSKSAPAATIGQAQQVTERIFLDGWDAEAEQTKNTKQGCKNDSQARAARSKAPY